MRASPLVLPTDIHHIRAQQSGVCSPFFHISIIGHWQDFL